MENVRTKITIIGTLIERHDQLVKDLADGQWMVEMVKLQDQLVGPAKDEAAKKVEGSYVYTKDQIARAERVALRLTNFDTMDELRNYFLRLVTAYNACTDAQEQEAKEDTLGVPPMLGAEEQRAAARAKLLELEVQCVINPPSALVSLSSGIELL